MVKVTNGIAQICMNGHVINAKTNDLILQQRYCAKCGEEIINKCLECGEQINGKLRQESQIEDDGYYYDSTPYHRPAFCIHCGKPYPWTIRAREAAYKLIDIADNLDQNEKDEWKRSVPALIIDSPKTSVSVVKFNIFSKKAGEVVGKAVKDIIIGVASETVKKLITG